jgi:uncharacterized membrane protein (UPF0182 family)
VDISLSRDQTQDSSGTVPLEAPAGEASAAPLTGLAAEARGHYDRAIEAQRSGDWATYGEELRLLGEVLANMRE